MQHVTVRKMAAVLAEIKKLDKPFWRGYPVSEFVGLNLVDYTKDGQFGVVANLWEDSWDSNACKQFRICDDAGKPGVFKSFLPVLKMWAVIVPDPPPVGDWRFWGDIECPAGVVSSLVRKGVSEMVEKKNMLSAKARQVARVAGIDGQLSVMAGWETGNAAQRARKADLMSAREVLVDDVAVIDARIAEIDAQLASLN